MTDEKITALEITLAHHERQIQDLNEMINRQWKEIDLLKRRLDKATSQLAELNTANTESDQSEPMTISEIAAAEKPPHY